MNTAMLKQIVLNNTIESSSDDLLMEELKGYIYSKAYEEDEREELGDEDEDNDGDERKELGDDEDDFEEEDDSDYDEDLDEDDEIEDEDDDD